MRGRDDAARLADALRSNRLSVIDPSSDYDADDPETDRAAELLEMLHELLVDRLARASKTPGQRCESCGYHPDDFDDDEGAS